MRAVAKPTTAGRRRSSARRRIASALSLAGLAALGVYVLTSADSAPTSTAAAAPPRPNVVVVMTDDQDQASVRVMPNVIARLGARGTTFANSFVNLSSCCPSRATFLTGQYAHNHGVSEFDGFTEFNAEHGDNNLPVWLQGNGYYTALIGKYLNGYGFPKMATLIPQGWDEWYAAIGGADPPVQAVYEYTLNENGTLVDYGDSVSDFKQDVFTAKAVDVIDRRAPAEQPFFLSVAYTAPHVGPNKTPNPPSDCYRSARPAPRHATAFDMEPLPQPPSFNEQDVSDKPPDIQALAPITAAERSDLTRTFRCRLESLLSVDEGVSAILDALISHHELGETLVIFTSDNGYFQGEHRVRDGKRRHYEPSTRVPLIVRGPGVPEGETVDELAGNADLAPTILDASGSSPRLEQDGRSLIDLARDPTLGRGRALLFETETYTAIRTARYKYVEHRAGESEGAVELYDLKLDPFELRSQHANPAYAVIRDLLADRLAALRSCAGASCREPLPALPPPLDLQAKKQTLKNKVKFFATASIASTLVATGKAIKKTTKRLVGKRETKIKAKLKRTQRKRLAHTLDEKGRAEIKIKGTATAPGGAAARDKVTVKFKK